MTRQHHIIIIRYFISLESAFWATLPLNSALDCTVEGSKEVQHNNNHSGQQDNVYSQRVNLQRSHFLSPVLQQCRLATKNKKHPNPKFLLLFEE